MSLPTLAALVVGGVVLVVLVAHLTGASRTDALDPDEVRAAWRLDHPTDAVAELTLTDDRLVALLELVDGRLGVVRRLGDGVVCRRVPRARVREGKGTLLVSLGDFGAAPLRLRLADDRIRDSWRRRLEALP